MPSTHCLPWLLSILPWHQIQSRVAETHFLSHYTIQPCHYTRQFKLPAYTPAHSIMISSASPHHIAVSALEHDLKSRQYLSSLLGDQIDKNELLQQENVRLEEEQRKLVDLLQRKTNEIAKLRAANTERTGSTPKKQQRMVSTQPVVPRSRSQAPQQQKHPHNDSTAIMNNTSINEHQQEIVDLLKNSIKEKEEEMKKMRDYYTKCLEKMEEDRAKERDKITEKCQKQYGEEMEEYRTVIGKQKNRIKQLMEAMEKVEQQKESHLSQIATLKAKPMATTTNQSDLIGQLQEQLAQQHSTHESQIIAIEQVHEEQKQSLLHAHARQLQGMQANTIYKIQQLQDKLQKTEVAHHRQLEQKEAALEQAKKECYALQGRLKEQLIRFEEQCEIVMNIQQDREKLAEELERLKEELRVSNEEKQHTEISRVNIDNIHKQYNIKNQQMAKEQAQLQGRVKELQQQLEAKDKVIQKSQQKIEEQIKKLNGQQFAIEKQQKSHKEQLTQLRQQLQYQQKQNQLKQQDNKRLLTKINKESDKKQQYIKKLQQKITKLQEELGENQQAMQEKESDVMRYREEMGNYVAKIKEELGKKDKELQAAAKENERVAKQMKEVQEKYEYTFATLSNQYQQANKKYGAICEKLRSLEQQKNNYKHLYDDSSKELKTLQAKRKKLSEQNQKHQDHIEKLEQQIQYLQEEVLSNNLSESEKVELDKLRNQSYELKARIVKFTQNLNKTKEENQKIIRQNLGLDSTVKNLQGQNTKLQNQIQMKKQTIEQQQQKIAQLEADLKQRCNQLQSSVPYLNQFIKEKQDNQALLQTKNNEIKKLLTLVQMAKKSKAEEIVNLTRELQSTNSKITQLEGDIKDQGAVIEKFNREKVNMLRENTQRQDLIKKLQNQNKNLKQNLKISQENVDNLMNFVDVAGSAMENVELDHFVPKKSHKK